MKALRSAFHLAALPIILIVVWWLTTRATTNIFVPKPDQLATTFIDVWVSERFLNDIVPSVARLLGGLVIAVVVGGLLGVLIGMFPKLRMALEPILEFLRALPAPVLVPVFMLVLGIGDGMKLTVIAFGCTWPILLNTIDGVRGLDQVLGETTRSYRVTGFNRLRYLIIPGTMPRLMTGVRQSLSIGLILMVISEMFASSSGLGFVIIVFQRTFAIPEMWSGIVLLGLIGLALSLFFQVIEKRVLAWYFGLKEVENAI